MKKLTVHELHRTQLSVARSLLAGKGFKIFTTAARHNQSGESFVAIDNNRYLNRFYLLCPRGNGLEIRSYTSNKLHRPLVRYLRTRLILPLRLGKELPSSVGNDIKRLIVSLQHEEYDILVSGARL